MISNVSFWQTALKWQDKQEGEEEKKKRTFGQKAKPYKFQGCIAFVIMFLFIFTDLKKNQVICGFEFEFFEFLCLLNIRLFTDAHLVNILFYSVNFLCVVSRSI